LATILQFWKKNSNSGVAMPQAPVGQADVLPEGKIDFSTVAVAAKPFEAPDILRDWSNQELADLYRVRQLLANAGVSVLADRGLSDEGDPWFVFCQEDGEVFVHLCRIDGFYLLDSPNLEEPLRGFGFNDLIDGFMQRASLLRTESNVVTLRRRDGIHLHPAILMTALIWSIYIASDELVGVAKAGEMPDGSGLHDGLSYPPTGEADLQHALRLVEDAVAEDDAGDKAAPVLTKAATAQKASGDAISTQTGQWAYASSSGVSGSGFSAQHLAMSLSVIAATLGFMPSSTMSDNGPLLEGDAAPEKDAEVAHLIFVEADETAVLHASSENEPGNPHAGDGNAASPVVQVVVEAKSVQLITDAAEHLAVTFVPTALDLIDVMKNQFNLAVLSEHHATGAADDGQIVAVSRTVASPADPAANLPESTGLAQYVATYSALKSDALQQYKLGDVTFVASIDVSKIAGLKIGSANSTMADLMINDKDWASNLDPSKNANGSGHSVNPDAASWIAQLPKYDDQVRSFVDFMLGKSQPVEFIALSNEVIFLDMSAFDEASDVSYAKSWVADDNSIVSLVGHMQDFVGFGLA
jgi:hypothetical protein